MQDILESNGELILLNPIRVETAIDRYPIHKLAKNKNGDIDIDLHETDDQGETILRWKVTYNSGFKQPGPMAYKLDTLIINRRIEEAPRPIPALIRLGSERGICRELGLNEGQGTQQVKQALHQNASTYIQAFIRYKTIDGTVVTAELGDTRYAVIFTGKKLPDGRTADAIYIRLHDDYREILNKSITRPLDYDYLKSLPPAPQRFYELLSYQMYSTLKYDRPRAKLAYSVLCMHAPQKRHATWDKVRSQMTKVHRHHLDSGYIKKVESQPTTDSHGNPDWIFFYSPGPKALAEYNAFNKRTLAREEEPEPLPLFSAPELSPLEAKLIGYGWQADAAAKAVQTYDEEKISNQIEYLEYEMAKRPGKIEDPARWLHTAITGPGYTKPKGFVSAAERQRRKDDDKAKERAKAEERRRQKEEDARLQAERKIINAYWAALTPQQQAEHDAAAIAAASPDDLDLILPGPMKKIGMGILRDNHTRTLLQAQGKLVVADA